MAEEKDNETAGSKFIGVKQGDFIVFSPGVGWRKGSENDLRKKLTREITRVGVALDDFEYESNKGADNHLVATCTLKQFYQDPSKSQWENAPRDTEEEALSTARSVIKRRIAAWNLKKQGAVLIGT